MSEFKQLNPKPNILPKLVYTEWTLSEPGFDSSLLHSRETIFTIGNGYMGTRGSFEEGYPDALPVTLVHGIYDDIPGTYTELVNCPDWLALTIVINGDRFRLDHGEILHYDRTLNLQNGTLSRAVRWRTPTGLTVDILFERFASLSHHQILCLSCLITPVDFDGLIEIQSTINAYPSNQGFNHWDQIQCGMTEHGMWLHVRTRSSLVELCMAANIIPIGDNVVTQVIRSFENPTYSFIFEANEGQTVGVEKIVSIFTSQDVEDPVGGAQASISNLSPYRDLLVSHQQAWLEVWKQSDIVIEGDVDAQLAVRYNLFQLYISACSCIKGECLNNSRVSVPAKGLSGLGYRGHVFWDSDIFIVPFFTLTQPHIACSLLTYRFHTLDGARRKAAHFGYRGAMFAWESAASGDEMTPQWSILTEPYKEASRIRNGELEIHISADVAYAIWQYWQVTGDKAWLRDYGAEIIFDTAIFWMSRLEWNAKHNRYDLLGVIGADEYHVPVNNNAFTNWMVKYNIIKALEVYDWLSLSYPNVASRLSQDLKLTPQLLSQLHAAAELIYTPYDDHSGLIEQFDGFYQLKDVNLGDFEPRDRSIQAVLGMDETNQSQLLKQPDVLMLLYLMRDTQVFDSRPDILDKNWNYYSPRTDTAYGSSLCPAIHSILASKLDKLPEAYMQFMQAAMVDLEDRRGNTAAGVHAASAGGVWQATVFGFGGIQLKDDVPIAVPSLPPTWTRLKFKLQWHGVCYNYDLTPPSTVVAPDIQGFIFDLDGVLSSTSETHYLAWQRVADEEGLPFDRHANEALRGISRKASLMHIIGSRHYSEAELLEMMERKDRYYIELIQALTPADLLPGVLELLKEIKLSKKKIAIGSASKNARSVVDKLGIAEFIDVIADGHSVKLPKPAPDLFLFAASELALEPVHCLVVEDATVGIEAANAAGMWSIGIGPQERVGAATIVLPGFQGIHLDDLQAQLRGKSLALS